jgi:hypothetical protein
MSQVSPKMIASPLLPLSYPSEHSQSNDTTSGNGNDQETSTSVQSSRPSPRVLDSLPDFTYDLTEQSRDPLDSWPGQVEMKPRRRSTLFSSLIRGNQPHRSFFGDNVKDDESEPAGAERNQASKALHNARRLSKTAASALKENVPLPASPWKQKRSPTQSENSRAREHTSIPFLSTSYDSPALHPLVCHDLVFLFQLWATERNSFYCSRRLSSLSARHLTASKANSSRCRTSCSSMPRSRISPASSWSRSTMAKRAQRSSTLCAPAGASLSPPSITSMTSTATSLMIASRSRMAPTRSTASSVHRHCTLSLCAVAWPSFVPLSYVLLPSVVVLSICGSAAPALVFCSTWVSKQRRRVLCTQTSMSMSLCVVVVQFAQVTICARISVSIIVSFVARSLSSIPGRLFCYSSISSAGVVLILPGFTICG